MDTIISISNGKVANVRKLIASADYRRECGLYVAEGANIVNDTPSNTIAEVYLTEKAKSKYTNDFAGNIYTVSDKVMNAMSDTKSPVGIIAVCKIPPFGELGNIDRRAILLDNLSDPGNIGTIIRSAVACGVESVLLYGDCADVYSPKVVRAAMGGVTHIKPINVDDLANLPDRIYVLDMNGVNVYELTEMPKEFILAVGSEAHGISKDIKERAKRILSLPMSVKMESLNAGVSLSIALYHFINGGK